MKQSFIKYLDNLKVERLDKDKHMRLMITKILSVYYYKTEKRTQLIITTEHLHYYPRQAFLKTYYFALQSCSVSVSVPDVA